MIDLLFARGLSHAQAKGAGTKPFAYKPLKTIKFIGAACGCGDTCSSAVSDLLRNGRDDVSIEAVELVDVGLTPLGAARLGQSLMLGANFSCRRLRLDLNPELRDAGEGSEP